MKKIEGKNYPYEYTDDIDLLIIDVGEGDFLGKFIFDKEILIKKGIISHKYKSGKTGV